MVPIHTVMQFQENQKQNQKSTKTTTKQKKQRLYLYAQQLFSTLCSKLKKEKALRN